MKKAFILIFDKDDNINYKEFHDKLITLENITNWWHHLKSCYILITTDNLTTLNKKILPLLPENKAFLLIETNLSSYTGKHYPKAWEWIKREREKINNNSLF